MSSVELPQKPEKPGGATPPEPSLTIKPSMFSRLRHYGGGALGTAVSYVPRSWGYAGTSFVGKKVVKYTAGASAIVGKGVRKVGEASKTLSESSAAHQVISQAPKAYKKVSDKVVETAKTQLGVQGDIAQVAGAATQAIAANIPVIGGPLAATAAAIQIAEAGERRLERGLLSNVTNYYIPVVTEGLRMSLTLLTPTLMKGVQWISTKTAEAGEALEKRAWTVYERPEAVGEYFTRIADSWYSRGWSVAQKFEYIEPGKGVPELSDQERRELEKLAPEDFEVIQFLVFEKATPLEREELKKLLSEKPEGYKEKLISRFKLLSFDERLRMSPGQIQTMSAQQKGELFKFVTRKHNIVLSTEDRVFLSKECIEKNALHGNWGNFTEEEADKLAKILARGANSLPRDELYDLLTPSLSMLRNLSQESLKELVRIIGEKIPAKETSESTRLKNIAEKIKQAEKVKNENPLHRKDQTFLLRMMKKHMSKEERILLYSDIFAQQSITLSKDTIGCLIEGYKQELKLDLLPDKREEIIKAIAVLEKALQAPPETAVEHPEITRIEVPLTRAQVVSQVTTPQTLRAAQKLEELIGQKVVSDTPLLTSGLRNTFGLIPLIISGIVGGTLAGASKTVASSFELSESQYEKIKNIPMVGEAIVNELVKLEKIKEGDETKYVVSIVPALMSSGLLLYKLAQMLPGFQGFVELGAEQMGVLPAFQTLDKAALYVPTLVARPVLWGISQLSSYAQAGVGQLKAFATYMTHVEDQARLATQVTQTTASAAQGFKATEAAFHELGSKIETYCAQAEDIHKICSSETLAFFGTGFFGTPPNFKERLASIGLTADKAKEMIDSIDVFLKTGVMPLKAGAESGAGYVLAPLTDAVADSYARFSNVLKGAYGYASSALSKTTELASQASEAVIGEAATASLGRAVGAVGKMPLVKEITQKVGDAGEAIGAQAKALAEGIVAKGSELAGYREAIPQDILPAFRTFADEAAKYHTALSLKKGCEDAQEMILALQSQWYGPFVQSCAENPKMNFMFRGMKQYVIPQLEGALDRIQDAALAGTAASELLDASLHKNAHLQELVSGGLAKLRTSAQEKMKEDDTGGTRASLLQAGATVAQVGFAAVGGGSLSLILFATRVLPEMMRGATDWMRVNGRETFSLYGDQIWQTSKGIGSKGQEGLARGLSTWLRSGYNWVTGTIDPKRIEQFIQLPKDEKIHLCQIVLSAITDPIQRQTVERYIKDLQGNSVTEVQEQEAVRAALKGFNRLTSSEKLQMSPAYYLDLDPLTQERVVQLVDHHLGIKEEEYGNVAAIVKKFNSLDPKIRAKIDDIPWTEFSRMTLDDQDDLLFKASQSSDWMKAKGVDAKTLQEKMKLSNDTRMMSTAELKKLLAVLKRQDSQGITFTPQNLRLGGRAKIVQAINIIKTYNIALYNELMSELRRFDSSANEKVFLEKISHLICDPQTEPLKEKTQRQAVLALACALNSLPDFEKRDFFDFTRQEFGERSAKEHQVILQFLIETAETQEQAKPFIQALGDINADKTLKAQTIDSIVIAFNKLDVAKKRQFRTASAFERNMTLKVQQAVQKELIHQFAETEMLKQKVTSYQTKKQFHALEIDNLEEQIKKLEKPKDDPKVKKLEKQLAKHKKEFQVDFKAHKYLSAKLKDAQEKEKIMLKILGKEPMSEDEFSILKISEQQRTQIAEKAVKTYVDVADEKNYLTIFAQLQIEDVSTKIAELSVTMKSMLKEFEGKVKTTREEIKKLKAEIEKLEATPGNEAQAFVLEQKLMILQDFERISLATLKVATESTKRFDRFFAIVGKKTISELQNPQKIRELVEFYKKEFNERLPPTHEDIEKFRKDVAAVIPEEPPDEAGGIQLPKVSFD
jgi:hypothetical protein